MATVYYCSNSNLPLLINYCYNKQLQLATNSWVVMNIQPLGIGKPTGIRGGYVFRREIANQQPISNQSTIPIPWVMNNPWGCVMEAIRSWPGAILVPWWNFFKLQLAGWPLDPKFGLLALVFDNYVVNNQHQFSIHEASIKHESALANKPSSQNW